MSDGNERGTPAGPSGDLYVYLIQGRVIEKDEADLGNAFLGNWVEDNNSFLFFSAPRREKVTALIRKRAELAFIEDYYLTYEQWQGSAYRPFRIEDFVVVPPWENKEAAEGQIRIILDPGLVFGTGLHPTTRDCLRALAYLKKRVQLGSVLDLGTGTGVLALAAALLGARSVLAADLNPLCVKTAIKNVRLNHLAGIIKVAEGPAAQFARHPADLVIANIHFEVIQQVLEQRVFRENERLILSGFTSSQVGSVKVQLERLHFEILREWSHGVWCTILAERGNTSSLRHP